VAASVNPATATRVPATLASTARVKPVGTRLLSESSSLSNAYPMTSSGKPPYQNMYNHAVL